MRILSTFFIFIMVSGLLGCTKGNEINGRSLKTANRSVNMIKNRLPDEQRIEFELSYWTIRDSIKSKDEFLDAVDGKNIEELIAMGKEVFQQRKNSGFADYDQYTNWDQMITKYTQDRLDQNKRRRPSAKDQANNVLYKL